MSFIYILILQIFSNMLHVCVCVCVYSLKGFSVIYCFCCYFFFIHSFFPFLLFLFVYLNYTQYYFCCLYLLQNLFLVFYTTSLFCIIIFFIRFSLHKKVEYYLYFLAIILYFPLFVCSFQLCHFASPSPNFLSIHLKFILTYIFVFIKLF